MTLSWCIFLLQLIYFPAYSIWIRNLNTFVYKGSFRYFLVVIRIMCLEGARNASRMQNLISGKASPRNDLGTFWKTSRQTEREAQNVMVQDVYELRPDLQDEANLMCNKLQWSQRLQTGKSADWSRYVETSVPRVQSDLQLRSFTWFHEWEMWRDMRTNPSDTLKIGEGRHRVAGSCSLLITCLKMCT
jgi:hypothetical protein